MIHIAHRGNISGISEDANAPFYLTRALDQGYHVEADVWVMDGKILLGHDEPEYLIDGSILHDERVWCHAKNPFALEWLLKEGVHCFWHQNDTYTLTSNGLAWVFPNEKLIKGCICVLPELGYDGDLSQCYAICSDYIEEYK